jgi:DNA-binding NarL/FixJ family response regulator
MFNKVLVAEDMDAINKGVLSILSNLNIQSIEQVQYCDDAYLKIKKAEKDNCPFELLITDLSFIDDHREQKYTSGEELIEVLQLENPNLKIIAYTIEDKIQKVRRLVNKYGISAYVCKGRRGLIELSEAISAVAKNKMYLSPLVEHALSSKSELEIKEYDLTLLDLLSKGLTQQEISLYFKENDITPNSLRAIEKHLNTLRTQFEANNAIHLVSIVKDLGLI